jgi:class 3 adenylate cyclase
VLNGRWSKLGFNLGLGIGIATGYATLGRIGFEGRYDYGMVGTAVIIAARLSSAALPDQILLNPRAHAAVDELVDVEELGGLELKGFARPVPTVNVLAARGGPAGGENGRVPVASATGAEAAS